MGIEPLPSAKEPTQLEKVERLYRQAFRALVLIISKLGHLYIVLFLILCRLFANIVGSQILCNGLVVDI